MEENPVELAKLNAGCCYGPKQCPEDLTKNICAYYNDNRTGQKVNLGGIYEPRPSRHSEVEVEEDNTENELNIEAQKNQEDRRLQCQKAMQKWSLEFLKKIPHPLAPCSGSQAQMAKKKFKDMEKVQSVTENIVEKFGGLTLGFSGPLPPPQVIQYHGLKVVPRHEPDYPEDLRMKGVRRPRIQRTPRNRRPWEADDSSENLEFPVSASFQPPSTTDDSSAPPTKGLSNVPRPRNDQSFLFLAGRDALEVKGGVSKAITAAPSRRTLKKPQMPPSADELILEYVDKFNLEMMFEYFLALTCLYTPENAFQFISDLAGKMVLARTDDVEFQTLDRIFNREHVQALFRLFDKEQNGFVTHKQYKTGMETLGLINYTKDPEGFLEDKIVETVFVDEGVQALDLLLKSFMIVV